ncbi:hypothetical protein VTN00DRAFT_6981 [Thermoascus crustaceus]|uniref:uncharacterized protein n=1 Tax=Thermoascus crustaceus TaxID=5088 RepID=UPI0037437E4D
MHHGRHSSTSWARNNIWDRDSHDADAGCTLPHLRKSRAGGLGHPRKELSCVWYDVLNYSNGKFTCPRRFSKSSWW